MAGVREDVTEALGRAVGIAGPQVLEQPKRLRAILADLVGQPASDHRAEIDAVVAAAEQLAGNRHRGNAGVVAALARSGIAEATAWWALSALHEHGVGAGDTTPSSPAQSRSRHWLWIPAACLLVLVPLGVWLLLPEPDPDPSDNGNGGEGEATGDTSDASTTTTVASAEADGFLVEFEPSAEGLFQVTRSWEISDGQVTGTVSLAGDGTGSTLHRELVPVEAFTDPVFAPEPDSQIRDVANFSLELPRDGEFSFTFEADLTVPEPDEATVQSWIDVWQDRVGDVRVLGSGPVPDAQITTLP